jgi:hypothetical protein
MINDHERLLIQNFVYKDRQERYLNLNQSRKGRIKFRKYISHFKDLNKDFVIAVPNIQTPHELYTILKSKGANNSCYIISEHSDYDGLCVDLDEGINSLFHSGISYFLSCIPGVLVYYEGEDKNQKLILVNETNHTYEKQKI